MCSAGIVYQHSLSLSTILFLVFLVTQGDQSCKHLKPLNNGHNPCACSLVMHKMGNELRLASLPCRAASVLMPMTSRINLKSWANMTAPWCLENGTVFLRNFKIVEPKVGNIFPGLGWLLPIC